MTRDEIITTVLSTLGRAESNSYLVAQAELELALIQERMEQGSMFYWFQVSDEESLVSVAGERAIDLPADFLMQHEDYPLFRYDSTLENPYVEMTKEEFNYLQSRYQSAAGEPTDYALLGTQIHQFPTPDDAYDFRWVYYKKGEVLSANTTTNIWTVNAADKLIGELGLVMAEFRRDEKAQQIFTTRIVRADARLLAYDEARKQAQRDARRGDKE